MLMRKQSVGKYCLWGNGLGTLRVLLVLLLLCRILAVRRVGSGPAARCGVLPL